MKVQLVCVTVIAGMSRSLNPVLASGAKVLSGQVGQVCRCTHRKCPRRR